MSVKIIRPAQADRTRLYYRSDFEIVKGKVGGHYKGPLFIPPRGNEQKGLFRLLDPDNVICQIRLYRWFSKIYKELQATEPDLYSGLILKRKLMMDCFADWPSINKIRVGRMLRMLVQYDVNFQRNGNETKLTEMYWRWSHPLDFIYALEHLMSNWLPRVIEADGGTCKDDDDLTEEFEILRDQTTTEDAELISTILRLNLY